MGSTNLQVGTIQVGLGYEDVKSIALDLWNANFHHLSAEAASTAQNRSAEIRDQIIESLKKSSDADPDAFSQVEKQSALFEAQKSYAISGDQELKEMLSDAVVSIAAQPERSLSSIVLHEAIKVMPSLTPGQLRLLAAVFAIRYVNFSSNSLGELFAHYEKSIGLAEAPISAKDGDYRHLQYCGCGSIVQFGGSSLHSILVRNFAGLISKGFEEDKLREAFAPSSMPGSGVMKCLRDPTKLQIAALNERVILERSATWDQRQTLVANEKLGENLLSEEELKSEISVLPPPASALLESWEEKGWKAFDLTSVGIAIAHTYVAQRHGSLGPLTIWL